MPGPWVAITGVTALGAVFFAIRQWLSLSHGIGKLPLQERVAALEGELSDARAKIVAVESEERRMKKNEEEWKKQNVGRVDRFHATKDALKGHINEASKAANCDDM